MPPKQIVEQLRQTQAKEADTKLPAYCFMIIFCLASNQKQPMHSSNQVNMTYSSTVTLTWLRERIFVVKQLP